MRLERKVAIITGGAQGIGEEISRTFAREGSIVFIADVRTKEGRDIAQTLRGEGVEALFLYLDVRDEMSWTEVAEKVVKKCGKLDILVNNAGITKRAPFEEYPVESWDDVMAVNVRGVFLGMKHAIPIMRKGGGGAIVNISSVAGLVGHPTTNEAYIASKGAVTLLTKGVATHFAKDKIRINSIHPCTVDTPLYQKDLAENPFKAKARLDEIPMGRLATTKDVANAALFLASDEAAFITGVSLPVDGGLTAY